MLAATHSRRPGAHSPHSGRHARTRRLPATLVLGIVAATAGTTLLGGAPALATAPPTPGVDNRSLPEGRIFYTNPGTDPNAPNAGFPALFNGSTTRADGSRASRFFVSYGVGVDAVGKNASALQISTDDGASWQPAALPSKFAQVVNAVRLADAAGTIVSIDYEPIQVSQGATGPAAITTFRRWTINSSNTWASAGNATVSFPGYPAPTSLRMQKGILLLGDGKTLVTTVYGADSGGSFTAVVRSTDDGLSWTQTARLAYGSRYSEANLAQTSDGKLATFLRQDTTIAGEDEWLPDLLYTASSTADGSGTWSAPVRMSSDTGNSPSLALLGNGAAVMGSGRPDNVIRYKNDGTAGWQGWTGRTSIYSNRPTGGSAGGRSLAAAGSSNTLALAPIDGHRLLAVGDNCASWGCPSTATGYPHGRSQALWKSTLEVNTAQWGGIDLATKFRRGEIAFVGSTFASYGRGRTSLGAYAFDGDVRADSSAVTSNRKLTLRLDRTYNLTGFAINAHLAGNADIAIETSVDGTTWTSPTRGTRVGALRPLSSPTAARYVRFSDPNLAVSDGSAFLNELQIYSTANGFEANVLGQVPAGDGVIAATTRKVTVIDSAAVSGWADPISSRFLELYDDDPNGVARIQWNHGTSTSATYSFKTRAVGTGTKTLLFSLLGTNSAGATVTPYHFALDAASRNLSVYSYATGTWKVVGQLPAANSWTWNSISVQAGPTAATLSANGQTIGTVAPSQPFSRLTGNQLGSGGTANDADLWYFDDVEYLRP